MAPSYVTYDNDEKQDRNAEIVRLRQKGMSYYKLAERFGISRQRVMQIYNRHLQREGMK